MDETRNHSYIRKLADEIADPSHCHSYLADTGLS